MNIRLVKMLDAVIGRILATLLPPPTSSVSAHEVHSVLLIRPGGIGDAVLLAPAIRHIKQILPHVRITILAEKRNAGVFSLVADVDQVLCYDIAGQFLQAVRHSYNVVIDTEQWHCLSAVVARLVKAPIKIGFATNERQRMFTHVASYSHEDYETVSFLRLLEQMGCAAGDYDKLLPFLAIPTDARIRAQQLLGQFYDTPYAVIFPGASIAERRWGKAKFSAVATHLNSLAVPVVVVGSSADWNDGEGIIATNTGTNLAGVTSIAETAAVIDRCIFLISNDSGILHIGVGLGVPTVSLFGAGIESKWAPRGKSHHVINKSLACSPCTHFGNTPQCTVQAKCMADISIEDVTEAVSCLHASISVKVGHNESSNK